MTQPEALRLADELDQYLYSVPAHPLCTDAAAELRRQHGEIKSMRTERLRSERRLSAVEAQRGELLYALERLLQSADVRDAADAGALKQARAAIKAVEGETK